MPEEPHDLARFDAQCDVVVRDDRPEPSRECLHLQHDVTHRASPISTIHACGIPPVFRYHEYLTTEGMSIPTERQLSWRDDRPHSDVPTSSAPQPCRTEE